MNFKHRIHDHFISGLLMSASMIIILLYACEKIEPERIVKVRTESISNIQYSSSIAEGILIDMTDGGITQHGHCWGTTENPTIGNPTKTTLGSRTSKGSFQSHLEELTPGTTYYVRAYGQKGDVVVYGENKSFITVAGELPAVITYDAIEVTMSSAVCRGEITADGGYPVTSRGICWNTSGDPSIHDNPTETDNTGLGVFDIELNGLNKRTSYYVKAYAINQMGPKLGDEVVFITSDIPSVITVQISSVKPNSVTCVGNVTDDGGTEVFSRGFCWDINPNPTKSGASQEFGDGPGEFTGTINELAPSTRYYIRAYAANINETVYGEELSFITSFVDTRDYKTYQVVLIGEQYWMSANLNYGNYLNSSENQTENEIVEKYCFDDNEDNCETYGGYYTWSEMMQYVTTESAQGVCPGGWHVPSDAEWKTMEMALGMSQSEADNEDWRGTTEGGKLKLEGTDYWQFPNEGATNESGFSALPGGFYTVQNIKFEGVGTTATFWTSTEAPDEFTAYYHHLDYTTAQIFRSPGYQGNSTPVRCVKD